MLLTPFESVLNRNIAASGAARDACLRLAGKTIAVHVKVSAQTTVLSLFFRSDGERMHLAAQSDSAPAAAISGTPLAYFSMVRRAPEAAMRSGEVRIEGDAEAAQTFRDLLRNAQPDLEEELSRLIGDVAAHQATKFARDAFGFGKRVVDTLAQNVAEFLQEESRDIVSRVEVDEFNSAVDDLRDAVDRVEARIALIERSRNPT